MVVIGVTGSVGTGKSTVAAMFKRLGAAVVDADAIAHALMRPGRPAWREIARGFGRGVLTADRTIDRPRLASLVFRDGRRRARLERILHPRVMRELARRVRRLRRSGRVRAAVLDVPLLVEVGAHRVADALVVVTAPRRVQRARLSKRQGWSAEEIDARIGAQWQLSAKVALADHVVDNSDGVGATRTQVRRIWNQLVARNSKSAARSK